MNEEVRHFSLRKLSVGLASVLVGVSIFGASQTVKADTVADQTASAVTGSMQNSDTQENGNAAESTFSNVNWVDNAKSNMAQTQENEPKQVQAENVQHDSAPKTQEVNNNDLGAEKSAAHTGSLQGSDNQSNTVTGKTVQHNALESGQKAQFFNLPKNSQKLNRKVLATNLIATPSVTNGGFDEATWGKLDVNDWQGQAENGVYQLTGYTGDPNHVIVPNEADFEKAGKSTNGLQVGITRDTAHSLLLKKQEQTIAFSKTNNQEVKAIGTDWSYAFATRQVYLSKFDGSGLDVSNVTDMSYMFYNTSISDLTSLANWDTSKVTDMSNMLGANQISDLTPLAHWDTSGVTDMSRMFSRNKVGDLASLANWNISKVTNMSYMFTSNLISDLTPLAHWDTSGVTDMSWMFESNPISDLTPLANWDTSKVTDMGEMFRNNSISDLTPLANWDTGNVTNMNAMFQDNSISNLTQLAHWDTSKVTNMDSMFSENQISNLTSLANWDISNVTDMNGMFFKNQLSDLSPLAHWDTSNVTSMNSMFFDNQISDLTPLAHWDTSKVTDMSYMFNSNSISDLTPLAHWDTSGVTDMSSMFWSNSISDLIPLANWDTSKLINMSYMFANNPDLIDLRPIADWNISSINNDYGFSSLFYSDNKLNLTNINNTPLMQGFLKTPEALQGATYITNNADLVKTTTGKDLPDSTNTAKRTITFNIPDATPETIVQTINYKAITTVQVNFDNEQIVKTYPVKESDWQLDTSKQNDDVIIDGVICFKPVKIPHVNGYKAHFVRNPLNPAMFMVSFMAVPIENKPSTPVEVTPSKPSAPVDDTSKPTDGLQKHVATELNSNDSGWTMPEETTTYTVEIPVDDAAIDLSDLVIAEPVHAQTRTQIHVTKRFKLSKKHLIKHLKHRKLVSKLFSKRYVSL